MAITIKRARMTVDLVTDLELQAEYEAALQKLSDAVEAAPAGMMVPDGDVTDAAKNVQDIERMIAETVLTFTLQAVDRKVYAEYSEAHPARPANDQDELYGLDSSQLDGLIAQSILRVNDASGTPVEFDPAAEWETLADDMSDVQYREFAKAILLLNRGVSEAPKSRAASVVIQRSDPS